MFEIADMILKFLTSSAIMNKASMISWATNDLYSPDLFYGSSGLISRSKLFTTKMLVYQISSRALGNDGGRRSTLCSWLSLSAGCLTIISIT